MVETFFTEKRIIKKIIIVLVFIFMFNFTFSYLGNNVVFADEQGEVMNDTDMEAAGGKLLLPIHDLILFLADAVLELMQNSFLTSDPITIKAYSPEVSKVDGWAIAGIAIGIIVIAIACVVTYGAGTAIVGAAAGATTLAAGVTAVTAAVSSVGGTFVGGIIFAGLGIATVAYNTDRFIDNIRGEFELPTIQYSPEAIFSNRIPLFNINFFNPPEAVYEEQYREEDDDREDVTTEAYNHAVYTYNQLIFHPDIANPKDKLTIVIQDFEVSKVTGSHSGGEDSISVSYNIYGKESGSMYHSNYEEIILSDVVTKLQSYYFYKNYKSITDSKLTEEEKNNAAWAGVAATPDDKVMKSVFFVTLAEILINNNPTENPAITLKTLTVSDSLKTLLQDLLNAVEKTGDPNDTTVIDIEEQVSKIATYMSTSQTSGDLEYELETVVIEYPSSAAVLQNTVASIYKSLRTLAIVTLLSILVYVGIRIVLTSTAKDKAKYKQMLIDWLVAFILLFVLHYMMAFIVDISEKLTQICNRSNVENVPIKIPNGTKVRDKNGNLSRLDNEEEGNTDSPPDIWGTNFIGSIRYYSGLVQKRGYTIKGVSYTIIYIVLVIYIAMFTFQYLKRVLYMAFLTMISPLVAITYPLDKINDGKAQGFSMWLKEYIFNALLQPIHYIIYIIIMGSVMDMVVDHPVYALVALGFMVPAEKFIRKMFGFEKASTVGAFGAAAGTAALMSGLQRLTHKPHGKSDDRKEKEGLPEGKVRSVNYLPDKKEGAGAANGNSNSGGTINGSGSITTGRTRTSSSTSTTSGDSTPRMFNTPIGRATQTDNEESDPRRRMLDADYEDFGSPDYDPHETAYLENDLSLNQPRYDGTEEQRRAELEDIFREQGMSEDEIAQEMRERGYIDPRREMLDVDYEDFGSPDYDPHETAYLENDLSLNQPRYDGTEEQRRAELEDIFREQGMSDDEIAEEMRSRGYAMVSPAVQPSNLEETSSVPEQTVTSTTPAVPTQPAIHTTPQTRTSTGVSSSISNNGHTPRKINGFKQGIKAVGGHYTRRLERRLRRGRPLKTLRRGLTFAVGAATLGAIGLAAGIASGDASKALQYTSAGALAGGHLGKNIGETASNAIGLDGAVKSFERGALGSKYNEHQKQKYKEDILRKEETYEAAMKKGLTSEDLRKMAEKGGIMDQAYEYGIYDINDQMNIYKAQKEIVARETSDKANAKIEAKEKERKRMAQEEIDKKEGLHRDADGNLVRNKTLTEDAKNRIRKRYALTEEEKESIRHEEGWTKEDEAADLAFAGYRLDKVFGDYSSNYKTQENMDNILKSRGYTDETEREQVKAGMLKTMNMYQDATYEEGTHRINSSSIDYAGIGNSTSTSTSNYDPPTSPGGGTPPTPPGGDGPSGRGTSGDGSSGRGTSGDGSSGGSDSRDDSNDHHTNPPTIPITQTQSSGDDAEARARAANAESDAAKEATKRKRKDQELDEMLESQRKAKKKQEAEEKKARAAEARARAKQAKSKKTDMEAHNGVENGEQGSQVRDFGTRKGTSIKGNFRTSQSSAETVTSLRGKSPRILKGPVSSDQQININPISSDTGTNGDGPLGNYKK